MGNEDLWWPGPAESPERGPSGSPMLWRILSRGSVTVAVICLWCAVAHTADWAQRRPIPKDSGLYQQKCGNCHPDAGRFATERLEVVGSQLRIKKSGRELRLLLRQHPGRLSDEELEDLLEFLAGIVTGGG